MTFIDIIKKNKNLDYILMQYDKKIQGLVSADEFYKSLNERFDVEWANETWSRYTNVLYEVHNAFKGGNKERLIDLEVQRHKNIQTRREIRHIARQRVLEDYIDELLDGKEFRRYFRQPTVPVVSPKKPIDVFISDIHYKDDAKYIYKFGKSLEKRVGGEPIVLHIVGDMVQGTLRLDDIYSGSVDVIQQSFDFCDALLESTANVNIEQIIVHAGNHDELRLTNYKGSMNPSLGKLVAKYLEKSLDCDVSFVNDGVEDDEMIVKHGHQFRGKKNMVEWGKEQNKMVVFGHYHSFAVDENVVMLPALCDSDEYAKSLNLSSRMGYVIIYKSSQIEFVQLQK